MRDYLNRILWGLVLIVIGGLFLAQNMGLIELSAQVWKFLMIGFSLLFFVSYLISGLKEWGWLFPAFIFAGVALTIALGEAQVDQHWVPIPIFASIAIPFLIVFLMDVRNNWWALIPAWVMATIASIILLAERIPGEAIGTLVMFSIAIPFLVVFLVNRREHWWALIPGGILATVGFIPLLTLRASGDLIGVFIMFLIAAPFFVVYFWSKDNWWALIPAGVMASVGLAILLSSGALGFRFGEDTPALIFLGTGLTFGLLWLRRETQPTGWAKWLALGMTGIGLVALLSSASVDLLWPVFLIAAGLALLWSNLRRKNSQP